MNKKRPLTFVSLAFAVIFAFGVAGCGNQKKSDSRNLSAAEYTQLSLSGTDSLGRSFLPADGSNDKYVGMFYFLWSGMHGTNTYDNDWLLENAPDDLWAANSKNSVNGLYHYWGEPLYGYYHMMDPWVITRHVEMLTNAGIDFLGLDVTNAVTYDTVVQVLLDTLLKYQRQGFDVPQVVFLTKSDSVKTVKNVYNKWYTQEKYDSLWFSPNGKPMIGGMKYGWDEADVPIRDFFDLKNMQWPKEVVNPDSIPWIDFAYPQTLYKKSGMMSVSVAQHNSLRMSNMGEGNHGRAYNPDTVSTDSSRIDYGDNYASQWATALSNEDVKITFVTGWNEWIAIKFTDSAGKVYFVDQFNEEYSRDIEPMKGGYGDCYYMQTIQNVRAFRGTSPVSYRYVDQTIDLDGDLSQWDQVKTEYVDFSGDAMTRDFMSAIPSRESYFDDSNRNDIVSVKTASDSEYLYFKVRTADTITAPEGSNWMNILVNVTNDKSAGFEGYNFLINGSVDLAAGKTSVSRFEGNGFGNAKNSEADIRISGDTMLVRVKLSDLGLTNKDRSFSFKVCDNVTNQSDIMDYYVSGDCAPLGRINYTYGY